MLPEWACLSSVAKTVARSGLTLRGMCAMVLTCVVNVSSRMALTIEFSKCLYFPSKPRAAAAHTPILPRSASSIVLRGVWVQDAWAGGGDAEENLGRNCIAVAVSAVIAAIPVGSMSVPAQRLLCPTRLRLQPARMNRLW